MEDTKIIGIIGAMDEEVDELKKIMTVENVENKAGLEFYEGMLKDKQIVVVRSGIGKVNAAICTQVLIDVFKVDYVVNTGVAGGINNVLEIGDVVISSDTAYHDFDATGFGYEVGHIPRMEVSFFKADEKLVEIAKEAGESIDLGHKIYTERIVSGDQFIADYDRKVQIDKDFSGYCTEMEGAAIAHVCFLNSVPFVIIRAISDKADHSAEVNFAEFVHKAAENSSKMIQIMLEKI